MELICELLLCSTAVREVGIRSRPWACFKGKCLRLELSACEYIIIDTNKVLSTKQITVCQRQSNYKGVSCVSIISDHHATLKIDLPLNGYINNGDPILQAELLSIEVLLKSIV